MSSPESVSAGVEAAVQRFGTIHVLSNTAGLFDDYVQALDTTPELWQRHCLETAQRRGAVEDQVPSWK